MFIAQLQFPSRFLLFVLLGNHFNDLQEIEAIDLQEPTGWTFIPLQSTVQPSANYSGKPLRFAFGVPRTN